MRSQDFLSLHPRLVLDDQWNPERSLKEFYNRVQDARRVSKGHPSRFHHYHYRRDIPKPPSREYLKELGRIADETHRILDFIRHTRIEIAEAAETQEISSDEKCNYLKSEMGMNIILPEGHIDEMRFSVTLFPKHRVIAIDGFPKDVIAEKEIVAGKIKVGISNAFKFIPVVGSHMEELLSIELNPWQFRLGSLRRVNVDFSGGFTSKPEWYFKKDGIKNDLKVALTIRKSKTVKKINGRVQAAWLYDPGFLRKVRIGTNARFLKVYE
jgi:hypothetical protein